MLSTMSSPLLTDSLASKTLITLSSATLFSAFLAWFRYRYLSLLPNEKTHLTALSDIRALLTPSSKPLPLLLEERSVPNARLIRAFGLSNTFVSSDIDVHASFVHDARALIRFAEGDGWPRFAEHATLAVEECMRKQARLNGRVAYDSAMQNVALHVILTTLFEVPADEIAVEDLAVVARGINDLWRLSKLPAPPPPHLLPAVNARLRRWIPAQPNPLDFVVPAFETMWRVTATTVAFVHADPAARAALAAYRAAPSRRRFEQFDAPGPNLPSTEALVAEAIRLHPPTRRIARQPAAPRHWFARRRRTLVADVGALHRAPAVWGVDADVYDPMRHHPARRTLAQAQAFMGFGAGRLKCVASMWAPQAAGLIVAAVCAALEDGLSIREGQELGGREGWAGWEVEHSQLSRQGAV